MQEKNSKQLIIKILLMAFVVFLINATHFHKLFSQIRVDTMLTMSDGKKMNSAYFRPLALTPKGGFPAVLLVHGYAGSKEDMTAIANLFALSGYYCVEYSVRGQGRPAGYGSEGEFNWLLEDRLLQDAKEILQWMQSNKDINKDKIGMLGGSQGGLITWNAAVNNLPIKCFVPIIAVPNMENTCLNNGCMNGFCYNALTNGWKSINYGKVMLDTLIPLVLNDDYPNLKKYLAANDIKDKLSGIKIPMFVALAWQDDLFRVSDMVEGLKKISTPVKLALYPGGHGMPQDPGQLLGLLSICTRFFDYWLKDIKTETIMAQDSAVTLIDAAENRIKNISLTMFKSCLPPITQPIKYYLANDKKLLNDKNVTVNNVNLKEAREYKKNISNDLTLNFFTEPFEKDTELISYKVKLYVGSNANKYQANVLLYDYNPMTRTNKAITRGSYQVRLGANDSKGVKEIEYMLSPQYYLLRKGHQIELRVKFGQPAIKAADEFGLSPYAPQSDALDTLYSNSLMKSYIELYPITNTSSEVVSQTETKVKSSGSGKMLSIGEDIVLDNNNINSVTIFNSIGEKVFMNVNLITQNQNNPEIRIPTHNFEPGMYGIYTLSDGKPFYQKIFLNR